MVEDAIVPALESAEDATDEFLRVYRLEKERTIPIRAKTTKSTEVAARAAPKPSTTHIPVQFQRYSKVFSEEASYRLPQHQPWDHAIDLKPNATMKNGSVYRLTSGKNTYL